MDLLGGLDYGSSMTSEAFKMTFGNRTQQYSANAPATLSLL